MRSFRTVQALAAAALAMSVSGMSNGDRADACVLLGLHDDLPTRSAAGFGIKGTADDTILSRTAYYEATQPLREGVRAAGRARTTQRSKLELRSDAEGAEAPLKLSGMLVDQRT